MADHRIDAKGARLFVRDEGSGPPVVLLHGLGLDCSLWDDIRARLPDHRLITPDLRGHGASGAPDGPYAMGLLVKDAETVMETLDVKDAVVTGHGLGGMIAQGLAIKRLDLVRALVLANTATKFGQPGPWHAQAKIVRSLGAQEMAEDAVWRWSAQDHAGWVERCLQKTSAEGYAACCEAIAGSDFWTPTSGLRLPALGIAGDRDKAMPPDLVRETTDLIPGSRFTLIKGAGHLTPLQDPDSFAAALLGFLAGIGHA